jgi:ADP-ribose pyrophosphatase YjhB (NUDIX family)
MPSFAHCPHCGASFGEERAWPRTCGGCRQTVYRNPLPVVVVLIPVPDKAGLLVIRRAIEPGKGKLALPGGFIDWNDATWQDAATREVREETGIRIRPEAVRLYRVVSTIDKKLIVFCTAEGIASADIPPLAGDGEASEQQVITGPVELAFSSHREVVGEYFSGRR